LNDKLNVTPFIVPHRDEFSETMGYKIEGKTKTNLFIPDNDKWYKWKKNIIEEVKKVDYVFLDATFPNQYEVKRAVSEISHPFIEETIQLFNSETLATKNKIIFIPFNHTNPTIKKQSVARKTIEKLVFDLLVKVITLNCKSYLTIAKIRSIPAKLLSNKGKYFSFLIQS
jgi:pyrroloquinoline quinone biosynthesis protein B